MKWTLGRCRIGDLLEERGGSMYELAARLQYKPEKLVDYMENRRVMPLAVALSIAETIGCDVRDLYERVDPPQTDREGESMGRQKG